MLVLSLIILDLNWRLCILFLENHVKLFKITGHIL